MQIIVTFWHKIYDITIRNHDTTCLSSTTRGLNEVLWMTISTASDLPEKVRSESVNRPFLPTRLPPPLDGYLHASHLRRFSASSPLCVLHRDTKHIKTPMAKRDTQDSIPQPGPGQPLAYIATTHI